MFMPMLKLGFHGREGGAAGGWAGRAKECRFIVLGDMSGVGGFEELRECGPAEPIGLVAALPPPESTVNGPFLPVDVVLGSFSMLGFLLALGPVVLEVDTLEGPAPPAAAAGGLGSNGRSFVVPDVLLEVVDRGDDFDEVVERGDGPLTGGEGEEVDEKGVMVDGGGMGGLLYVTSR